MLENGAHASLKDHHGNLITIVYFLRNRLHYLQSFNDQNLMEIDDALNILLHV
jgi:hypothetical protein